MRAGIFVYLAHFRQYMTDIADKYMDQVRSEQEEIFFQIVFR